MASSSEPVPSPMGVPGRPGGFQKRGETGHLAALVPEQHPVQEFALGHVSLALLQGHGVAENVGENLGSRHAVEALEQAQGVGAQVEVAEQELEGAGVGGGVVDEHAVHIKNECGKQNQ